MEHFTMLSALLAFGLFFGMLFFLEAGRRMGARHASGESNIEAINIGSLEGSIFALFGLLIAFTYSGALARFDTRRQLDVEEANDIGTAYLRLNLLPADAQADLRNLFRQYVAARLEIYHKLPDIEAAQNELARVTALQGEIWSRAVAATQRANTPAPPVLVLPALNAMIDITTTQAMAGKLHPPPIVFAMLYVLSLATSLLAGYDISSARDRHWIHVLCFVAAIAFTFYIVLNIEYPRLGVIRIKEFDQPLIELLAGMK